MIATILNPILWFKKTNAVKAYRKWKYNPAIPRELRAAVVILELFSVAALWVGLFLGIGYLTNPTVPIFIMCVIYVIFLVGKFVMDYLKYQERRNL